MTVTIPTPPTIERAKAVLRVRLADFVFPRLAEHVQRMRQLRKAAPDDPFFVCLDLTQGDKLIPILSELHSEERGGVSLSTPFNLALPREIALAFVNLIAHILFLEGLKLSVGFANAEGYGYVFRITGIDNDGFADIQTNQLLGQMEIGGVQQ